MDFLRNLFGLKSPNQQPTFPENDGRNQGDEHPYFSPFTFSFSNELNSEFGQPPSAYSGGSYQDLGFMDSLREIEQMMDMFQRAMLDFDFKEPGLLPPPDIAPDTSQNLSPRDRFLKAPDSHLPSSPQYEDADASPGSSTVVPRPRQFYSDSPHHDHGWNPGSGFGSIFRMMDEFMKPFMTDDFLRHGDHFVSSDDDVTPGAELHPQGPREALLKQDQDLDKRPPQDLQELLKEGPGYSAGGPHGEQVQPALQSPVLGSNFTSTSISRTFRPDGVIEERRTYRDSSGREEVTVTELDPATTQSLVPNPFSGHGGGFHSFFGKFF